MPDPLEVVDAALTEQERYFLQCGLREWGGPARCTDVMAAAMGFTDVTHLLEECHRLRAAVEDGEPLSRWDWSRVLLATEIVFVSNVVGAGWDWSITTGLGDVDTIRVLRAVQRTLATVTVPHSAWEAATSRGSG